MKSFSQFLKEDPNKPIKQFGDNVTSSARVKATSDILKAGGIKSSQKKTAADVLGNLNRFFTDKPDSETLKTKPTGDEGQFRRKANRVVDRPLKKTIPGVSKKVTVGALEKRDASIKKLDDVIIKPQPGDAEKTKDLIKKLKKEPNKVKTPPVTTTPNPKVTTGNKINFVEPKPIQKGIPGIKGDEPAVKPKRRYKRTKVTSYTTTPKSSLDVVGTMKRGLERTGLKPINPKEKVGSKVKSIAKSKVTKNIIKKTPKKLVFNRALSGLGRVASGAFAVKDFMDTAKKEKALGRSKTAARLRGASKALGGYIGGGIGALAGGLAGGGVASAGLGIAGGIAGYSAGSKIGDQIYKTGRNLVTGKKTFKDLRKDINKGVKSVPKKIDKLLSPT